jgi:hypothetical protein
VTNRNFRLVEFEPSEAHALRVLADIRENVAPKVRAIQRKRRRQALLKKCLPVVLFFLGLGFMAYLASGAVGNWRAFGAVGAGIALGLGVGFAIRWGLERRQ